MNNFGAQNMVATLKRVLMKKPQPFMSKVDPQKWNYIAPLKQRLIDENYNEFYQIIKNSGAEIIELQMIDENEELCDSIFTHDPSLVLNEGAIVLNMGKQLRKKETLAHRKLYESLDIPIVGSIIDGGTVEGGDCLWINNKTLIVGESYRTNKYGIDQLYERVFMIGSRTLGGIFWKYGDRLIIDDGLVNGTARLVGRVSSIVRLLQTGYVYHYAFAIIIGLVVLMSWVFWL